MKPKHISGAIMRRLSAAHAFCMERYGLDLLRLLAFTFGHALTLKMPGLGTGNCNACLLHGLLFFGMRGSTGQATYAPAAFTALPATAFPQRFCLTCSARYHGLSTLYGHIAGAVIGMTALYIFPANHYRLVVFTVLAVFVSALMLNSSTNFFGLICIIFMSSVVLANWETPFADVQMFDIWSDFYGTCAAVATNILFHIVYPMPSSRHNLYRGLAQRIRAAALRASQYTEHFLNLYGSTDRDDRAFLPLDDAVLAACIGPSFDPHQHIFQMRSELHVTQREIDAATRVVQTVDSLFTAVESMAMPLSQRQPKADRKAEPLRAAASAPATSSQPRLRRRVSVDVQTTEEKEVREMESNRRLISRAKWLEWRGFNDVGANGKRQDTPRFQALQACHAQLLLELADKLELACDNAPPRRFPRRSVDDLVRCAYDSLLSEDDAGHSRHGECDGAVLLNRAEFLDGGGLLNADKIQRFYDSIANQFFPLFGHSKFNHMFANDFDSGSVLCGINGVQLLQESAMCIAPLRCWCSIAAMFYTLASTTYEEAKPSFMLSTRHFALRFARILTAPITAIIGVVFTQLKDLVKNPKKFWKMHFRRDLGDGLFLLKFGIGLLLLNLPVVFIPGIDDLFNSNHGSWVVFSYMFCLDKTRESSFRNSLNRLLATAAAGLVGLCAVFLLDYSTAAFNLLCTVGVGCIAGGVAAPLRQHMSTFLSAFIVCVTCPLTYGSNPSYVSLLIRALSVIIGGSAAVFVSTFLWPISAYKRVKIEIATAVERMTECLQNTEPYIIDDVVSSARNAAKVPPSGAKADEALHPVSAETITVKHWLHEHLRNDISRPDSASDSVRSSQSSKTQLAEMEQLLSQSFSNLRRALSMIQMIDIAQNARVKALMSGVERNYAKIDKVREQLYVTLLLHMSVAISVQACFRPPVKKGAYTLGFYASLAALEESYISRNSEPELQLFCDHNAGDFERIVQSELKNVVVLLHAWEVKVWPKPKRLCVLADSAARVANSHCLLIQKNVNAQLHKLTSCDGSGLAGHVRMSSNGIPYPRSPRQLHDDLMLAHSQISRSESLSSRFIRTSKGFGFDEFTRFTSVLFGPRFGVQLMTKVTGADELNEAVEEEEQKEEEETA